jgi:hypothetical protein
VQDFEGQRLAEMLTTVLLGAAGVGLPLSLYIVILTTVDHCFLDRLLHTRYPADPLCGAGRYRAHFPRCRSAVALLQQESRGLVASKQRKAGHQHRRGRAESWLIVLNKRQEFGRVTCGSDSGNCLRLNGYVHSTMDRTCDAITHMVLL